MFAMVESVLSNTIGSSGEKKDLEKIHKYSTLIFQNVAITSPSILQMA
jgi:hypothetical protein